MRASLFVFTLLCVATFAITPSQATHPFDVIRDFFARLFNHRAHDDSNTNSTTTESYIKHNHTQSSVINNGSSNSDSYTDYALMFLPHKNKTTTTNSTSRNSSKLFDHNDYSQQFGNNKDSLNGIIDEDLDSTNGRYDSAATGYPQFSNQDQSNLNYGNYYDPQDRANYEASLVTESTFSDVKPASSVSPETDKNKSKDNVKDNDHEQQKDDINGLVFDDPSANKVPQAV